MDAWILIWNFGFVWISCLDICLWVMGCRKPNPRMNLCMELLTLYMNSIMNHMDFVWDSREGYEFQI